MPWKIVKGAGKCGGAKPWAVVSKESGSVKGCHESRSAALKQMRALYVHEPQAASLVAAAGDLPPQRWFVDPGLARPTPLTVTADGQVFGHLALWDSCHMGDPRGPGVCVRPPRSATGYSLFHLGESETQEGELLATGKITLGIGHASVQASRRAAAEHYDNASAVVADVRAGEDRHGIWVAGALRRGVTDERRQALRAATLSGDWRHHGAGLELVGALAVNVPGYPVPRTQAMVAAAEEGDQALALVAAGVVEPCDCQDTDDVLAALASQLDPDFQHQLDLFNLAASLA